MPFIVAISGVAIEIITIVISDTHRYDCQSDDAA